MTLALNRGRPSGELQGPSTGAVKAVVSEFGDGVMGPMAGQRSGFPFPWPGFLTGWYAWSTVIDGSGSVALVPFSAVFKGWHKAWVDAVFVYATPGQNPTVVAATQGTGLSSAWGVTQFNFLDQWEWELVSFSGAGTKLYIAQLVRQV